MATAAQAAANRANARRSTGPRTPEGKAASAANGVRHGFRSQSVLLPSDDPAEYQALIDQLTEHFEINPKDLTAARFVREMADAEWRLRRARTHQEAALAAKVAEIAAAGLNPNPHEVEYNAHEDLLANSTYFRQLIRFEEKFERQYTRAYNAWVTYQEKTGRLRSRVADMVAFSNLYAPFAAAGRETRNDTTEPKSPAPSESATPRNAPCPCGSNEKFKRCCGKSAPPVTGSAARAAA
ncbi:MAG: SEC-C domain-containing protein [Bryobacteraceae bacterium]